GGALRSFETAGSPVSQRVEQRDQAATSCDGERGERRGKPRLAVAHPADSFSASRSSIGCNEWVCGPVGASAGGQPGRLPTARRRDFAARRSGALPGVWRELGGCPFAGSRDVTPVRNPLLQT